MGLCHLSRMNAVNIGSAGVDILGRYYSGQTGPCPVFGTVRGYYRVGPAAVVCCAGLLRSVPDIFLYLLA